MMNGSLDLHGSAGNPLGDFLRDRRRKLDPTSLGFTSGRRRIPGLRREEVAQRANISVNWYICLEQGRGGAPSPDVLDRIAHALLLTDAERQHLFLLGIGRSPEPRFRREDGVSPRLQHVLDVLNPALAFIRTATWDVVAWNGALAAVMVDFALIPPEQRNFLRFIFLNPVARAVQFNWESVASDMVAAFRAEAMKAGAASDAAALVEELSGLSPEFRRIWRANNVLGSEIPSKLVLHPTLGAVNFECSSFSVDGRQDLSMFVFYPVDDVKERILEMIESREESMMHDRNCRSGDQKV